MTPVLATGSVLLAAVATLGALTAWAPDYLAARGFPLDDSWIHAVYGRSLARSGILAYNPGIPATGATSPLWAVALAGPHLLFEGVGLVVLVIKLIGFGLHALTSLLVLRALGDGPVPSERLVGALLVALHPDLVSASVSGMEVPLSTLMACGLLLTARGHASWAHTALSAVAPLARPELAVLCFALPVTLYLRRDHGRLLRMVAAAAAGTVLSFGLLSIRNLLVSGLPLPATFYAKAGAGGLSLPLAEYRGFGALLGTLPIADSSLILGAVTLVAALTLWARTADPDRLNASAALVSALAFCAVSFALVRPVDPDAFYHQRYVLPVLPLVVGGVPVLLSAVLSALLPKGRPLAVARAAALALLAASLLIDTPTRYARLANDARNIDDVQVNVGTALASARPGEAVWAIDAGAVRYFGSAFVVDMIGLNNAELLGGGAQAFLDAYPPRYIEIVPGWSAIDPQAMSQLRGAVFKPSTPYTVTGFSPMQEHVLALCDRPDLVGRVQVGQRSFIFRCASNAHP